MEQVNRQADQISSIPNVTYDVIAVLHNKLQGVAAIEGYRRDARDAGDRELDALFTDLAKSDLAQVERLRQALVERLQGAAPWIASATGEVTTSTH
jgi:hypothetical protein